MKKIFWIAAAATGLLAASCQKETASASQSENEEAIAVLSVAFPENIATRSYSDGKSAKELHYAVYDGTTGRYLLGSDQPLEVKADLTCEVELRLVKNFAYDIVFWAQAPGAPYAFDKENATITVTDNYTNWANDDSRDAFYQLVDDYKVVPNPTKVDLYRPFAQINFGASDYKKVTELGLIMSSKAELSGLPNVLNVLTRKAEGSVDASFTTSYVPALSGEKLKVKDDEETYGYVSMNYVLAPEEKGMIDNVTGRFYYNDDEITIPVTNVPYQRNYRTNIIGEFFTGPAQFIVEIIPIFDKPAYLKILETVVIDDSPAGGIARYENVNLDVEGAIAEVNVSTSLEFWNSTLKADKGIILNDYCTVVLYNCDITLPDGEYVVVDNTATPTTWLYYDKVTVNGVTVNKGNWEQYFKVANAINQNFE